MMMPQRPVVQGGAALIMALLVVALATVLASTMIWRQDMWLRQVETRRDLAQARLLAIAGIDWARAVLAEDARTSSTDHLGEPWATKVPAMPAEGGEIGGELADEQAKWNLNNLVRNGQVQPDSMAVLGRLLEQPGLPAKTREKAARAKAEFLDSTVVLEELARARQTVPRLHELEKSVQAFFKQDNGGAPAHEAWRIGRPIPKSQREKNASVQELTDSLPRLAKAVESVRFKFEKFQKRWELVTTKGFSKRLQESVRKGYEEFLGEALNAIRALNSSITRVSAVSLPKGFRDPGAIEGRMRSVIWVPDNKNLRLRVKGDTAEVRVLFETDIQEDAVLAAIKASIEDYWRGEFDYGGKTMRFKTSVSIRKVQTFSPGAQTLRAAVDTVAHAGQTGIVFDRDLDYPTPAHEFGHILGLNDEYTEGYRAADRTAVSRQNAGSLMGSLGGDVLPRHLKTAYQLLKRRSLEKD